MSSVAIPLRIPEKILAVSRLRAEEEHVDQATALRQFLYIGVEECVVQLVAAGRISIGKAAELLNTSHYDLYLVAQKHGITLSASVGQAKKSRMHLQKLLKK